MHPNGWRIAPMMLFLLASCGSPSETSASPTEADTPVTQPTDVASSPAPVSRISGPASGTSPVCEPDAPESPCPIVGRWRIARVYNPAEADLLADDRAMTGATLTITANGDGPGMLAWDGPDTGQFDISDRCIGPYLSARGTPAGDPAAARTLAAALSAWSVGGDAAAARALGCDQGHWAVPTNAAGDRYGIVLPLGNRAAIQWYEDRFLLLERTD
ncbi:hypothetical protein PK98_00250 [Croceibacterium mercuriale]|uniref:Uncharacterized protein n=1 Tax=Croceibacterium mercuriale TaxID=1572751 RepID=A0A0B2BUK9_9SPHN|nr:hypothetical protein [Croceibacterium mercuriale]KHL25238.1 hypothetical protein PK98_00250 [Croceibacterium mercuriale]